MPDPDLQSTANGQHGNYTGLSASPPRLGLRIFCFHSLVLLATGAAALLFADLLWRTGWSWLRMMLLVMYIILFYFSAVGALNGIYGFFLRRHQRSGGLSRPPGQSLGDATIALVVPTFNEEVTRVFEGLRATYLSLEKTGELGKFDFFVLSDSTDPAKWVAEERQWFEAIRELDALGRIYYRHRVANEDKKSGNIRDFLRSWGRRYRYFVILDADSIMSGGTLVELVKLMEANPRAGLIQTVPALVNAESLFGRMQQFAGRFYTPVFLTGMDYWSQGSGNYWGHNAIIRTEPFMRHCDLPKLPGRKPLGGQVLSHDFVEAALLLRANWQVWLAHDLEGSYEEAPQGLIENAARDRRWCQGNMQHAMVLFARHLRGISRWHLAQGVFGYLSGLLWFDFLLTFNLVCLRQKTTGLSQITVHSWSSFLDLTGSQEAMLVFSLSLAIILLPRALAIADLALDRKRRAAFGGLARAAASVGLEVLFSTLIAPLQMLWHSQFVSSIMLGNSSGWEAQRRAAAGTTWRYAFGRLWGHTLTGIVWGAAVWFLTPGIFWWFFPVLAGMLLCIPLTVFSSRPAWGAGLRNAGLFLTPEETAPSPQLGTLRNRMAVVTDSGEPRSARSEIEEIIVDPYANAIHVSLLRESRLHPEYAAQLDKLGVGGPGIADLAEKLLRQGLETARPEEKRLIMCDAETLSWLHRQVWLRPQKSIARSWRDSLRQYSG